MPTAQNAGSARKVGAFAPLAEPTFRRIWTASLFSNFGQLILGVGAAWEMARMTSNSPTMVALVQSAMMFPLMLVAVPAGAVADMFDRRHIALTGLGFATLSSATLTGLAFAGVVTPWMLLGFCVLIGGGVALYSPSWQASISEQVSAEHLPAAIGLGSISYNVARSFGPALGGMIVLAAGAKVAFGINAVFYLPLLTAFFFWQRRHRPSRLPPERIDRAIVSGARYTFHSPPIRTVLLRACMFGICNAASTALGPVIVKTLLHGDAGTYGLMLGATGVGAVGGALLLSELKQRASVEHLVRWFAIMNGASVLTLAISHSSTLSAAAFFIIGFSGMQTVSLFNISVQLTAPRWVTARALSLYSSALTGGIAGGAWGWGTLASHYGVSVALAVAGGAAASTTLLGMILPLPRDEEADTEEVRLENELEVALALTLRSGPVVIEVEYEVDPAQARNFYEAALDLQRLRHRNGGFDWSLSRDIADPAVWTERYHCPTWGDYLRMRDRYTQSDIAIQARVYTYCRTEGAKSVRRFLERPFGSVRWKADSPDPHIGTTIGFMGP